MSRSIVGLSLIGFLGLAGCSSESTTPAPAGTAGGGSGTDTGGSTSSGGSGTGGSTTGAGGSSTGGSTTGAGGSSTGGSTTGAGGSSTGTPSYADAKALIDAYHAAHPGREGDITIMTDAQLAADPDAKRIHDLCGPDQIPVIPLLTWEYGGNDHAWMNPDQSPLVICVYAAANPSTEHFKYDAPPADHITVDVRVLYPDQNPCNSRTGADQVLGCIGDQTNLEILVDTASIRDGADVGLALANASTDVYLIRSDGSKVLLYQNV